MRYCRPKHRNTALFAGLLAFIVAGPGTPGVAVAQVTDTIHITGVVTDALNGRPISGATVRVYVLTPSPDGSTWLEPTLLGAVADPSGLFEIRGAADSGGYFLQISSVGYVTTQFEYRSSPIDARLGPSAPATVPVTVIGKRRSRSVEDACCRVESIREEVQQHAPFTRGVDRILRRYSSCTSTRVSCAIDGASSVRLRGLEPTSTRVLMDGAPVMGGLSAYYGLTMIPTQALQTIRIVEGASDARYGDGAVSGVIDLEVRQPTEESEGSLSLVLSGPALPEQHVTSGASWTGMVDDIGIAAFASAAINRPGDGNTSETDGSRANSLVRGNILLDDETEMILTIGGGIERRNGRVSTADGTTSPFQESLDLQRGDVGMKLSRVVSNEVTVDLSLHGALFALDGSTGGSRVSATQHTGYGRATFGLELKPATMLAGLEYFTERLRERDFGEIDYDIVVSSAFIQNQWDVSAAWSVLTGMRLDHHNLAGTVLNPRAALRWSPENDITMRLMVGTGFKGAALFTEDHRTLMRTIVWRSNPRFDPERSLTFNYDVSYDVSLGRSVFLQANLNAYSTSLTGAAIPDPDSLSDNIYFPINSPNRRMLRGLEVQTRWSLGSAWSASLAASVIDYATVFPNGENLRVPLAPGINVDASVMFVDKPSQFTIETWGSLIGSQRLPNNPWGIEASPSYLLLNARIEKRLGAVSVIGGVLNALDKQQLDHTPLTFERESGRYDGSVVWGSVEGREFFLGLQWTVGAPGEDEESGSN